MGYWATLAAAVFGKTLTAQDEELYQVLGGGETWAGEPVSTAKAMRLGAWFACTRLIAQTIATLPVGVYRRNADGSKELLADHPLYRLLHDSPNASQTAVEFWEGGVLGLCTAGNSFSEKVTRGDGSLIALDPLPKGSSVRLLKDGSLEFSFYDRGKREVLPEDKVFIIKGFGDGPLGMSPVAQARQTLGLSIATDRAAAQHFSKGLRAKGFFQMAGKLDAEQRKDAKKVLVDAYSGPDAPWAGVLEAGVTWHGVNITPKDAEMILSRKFNVEDICRWLGVPPILIGHAAEGQTMWGSGIEQILIGWLTLGLRPYLTRIEQAGKKRLLSPAERAAGIFIEFNIEGLLRADSAGRAEMYLKLFQMASVSPNQVADKENLPRFEGGDRRFVNSTFVPIELAGTQNAPPLVRTS